MQDRYETPIMLLLEFEAKDIVTASKVTIRTGGGTTTEVDW